MTDHPTVRPPGLGPLLRPTHLESARARLGLVGIAVGISGVTVPARLGSP